MAHFDRRAVGKAGELAEAAPGAEQRGIAGKVRVRPALPRGRNRKHDDIALHRLQCFIAQSQPRDHPGPEAFGRDIRFGYQPQGQGHAFRLLEVDPHRQLGRGDLVECRRAHAAIDRVRLPEGIGPHRAFDLDHFGAELAQHMRGERPGVVHSEIGDADAGEGLGHAQRSPRTGGPPRKASGAPSKWKGETSISRSPAPGTSTG